ncbi:hypothetical protein [Rothia nasimurium]|uniref:hypothetical protein n=1 Tax=Rothia nasimurium TaxID=85336 RepID=UPI001F3DF531|nr:hypothetical protein [Rothia nasimurium]
MQYIKKIGSLLKYKSIGFIGRRYNEFGANLDESKNYIEKTFNRLLDSNYKKPSDSSALITERYEDFALHTLLWGALFFMAGIIYSFLSSIFSDKLVMYTFTGTIIFLTGVFLAINSIYLFANPLSRPLVKLQRQVFIAIFSATTVAVSVSAIGASGPQIHEGNLSLLIGFILACVIVFIPFFQCSYILYLLDEHFEQSE